MPPSSDVSRARFARFIRRVLSDAHDRGLTDREIARLTTVGTSTFHRWARGEFATAPDLDRVRAFCSALDVPADAALAALGVTGRRDETEPEPPIDPDVRRILRMLNDPAYSDEEKQAIRQVLRLLARQRRPHNTNSA